MNTRNFLQAVRDNNKDQVQYWLQQGLNAQTVNEANESALDVALECGHTDIADLLMSTHQPLVSAARSNEALRSDDHHNALAIVGMSCRFAGEADNLDHFWDSLLNESDPITSMPADRFRDSKTKQRTERFRAAFLKKDISLFDAGFFRISDAEAHMMDPQQRLLLEETYHAFEQGGFNITDYSGKKVGVFVGEMTHDYMDVMRGDTDEGDARLATGNIGSVLSGRISYLYNFLGEALTINTACSSSLVCMHYAAKSLRDGTIDMAVVAGVNAIIDPRLLETAERAKMTSPDGVCKAFDESANGYGRGEGVGVILLKREHDARLAGDQILALMRGSAINQDGSSSQLTAPNKIQQIAVVEAAHRDSQITPDDIDFIEAHGTGTVLGDQIEASALNQVFSQRRRKEPVGISSVKANIGHCEAAAGMAGVIKTVLALQHQRFPGQARLEKLNPQLDLSTGKLAIQRTPYDWRSSSDHKRRAGVSSFGFSGTNAHVVIEEAPTQTRSLNKSFNAPLTFILSAKSLPALSQLVRNMIEWLQDHPDTNQDDLYDLAYTLATGREIHRYRFICQASDRQALLLQWNNYQEASITANQSKLDLSHWQQQPGKKIALPLYPFQAKKYWYDQVLKLRQHDSHTFISTYRIDLSHSDWRMFAAHRVDGKVIFPATGYVTLMMQALSKFANDKVTHFEYVNFEQPLSLSENQATECQVRSTLDASGDYLVEFHTNVCHAKARVSFNAAISQPTEAFKDRSKSDMQSVTTQSIYDRLAMLDLCYDDGWQLASPVFTHQNEIYFQLAVDKVRNAPYELAKYLDIALHSTIPLIAADELKQNESLIPKSFRNLSLSGLITGTVSVRATRLADQDGIRISLQFIDNKQVVIAEIKEYIIAKRTRTLNKSTDLAGTCYSLDWIEDPLSSQLAQGTHFEFGLDIKELTVQPVNIPLPVKDDTWLTNFGIIVIQSILVKRWPALQTKGSILNIAKPQIGELSHPHFKSLFERLFKYLESHKLITISDHQATVISPLPDLSVLQKIKSSMQPDQNDIQSIFLHHVSKHIEEILDGHMDALKALFPLAANVYQEARDPKFANANVSAVVAALQSFMSTETIRILEIGAGTGGTTRAILPHLKHKQVNYVYTDITPSFAEACDDCFASSSINYRFDTLDISKNPRSQGFADQQFDLIIATNVLHATPDLNETLFHVRQLLAENGLLVMSETVQDSPWLDLTFGLTPGWWMFNDTVRSESPLLSRETWGKLLDRHGLPCERLLGDTQSVFVSKRGPQPAALLKQSSPVFLFTNDSSIQQFLEQQGTTTIITNTLHEIALADNPTVLYFATTEVSEGMTIDEQAKIVEPFLHLMQALHGKRATLALVTENMVAVNNNDVWMNPFNTTLRGLLASAATENTKWRVRLIDTDIPLTKDAQLAAKIIGLIYQNTTETEFAIRDNKIFSQLLQKRPEWLPTQTTHLSVADNEVIVITGGTGEIGLALLHDLRSQGHKKFALLARQLPANAYDFPDDISVKIYTDALDNYQTLQNTWQKINVELGNVAAIYHLAGTLADHALSSMNMDAMNRVFRAKVTGTYNLHRITLLNPVKQFVLFSSVASFLSSAGQMNHVAANRYLDAIAAYRRSLGHSAIAINWGFWSQIGSAALRKADQLGAAKGYLALTPTEALQALRRVQSSSPVQVVLARFDWELFVNQFTLSAVPPRYRAIANVYAQSSPQKLFNWQAFQQQYPQALQQQHGIAELIIDILSDILMLQDRSMISINDDFTQFPVQIDSLANTMFVERVNQLFGWQDSPKALTTNLIYNGGSIATLVKGIIADFQHKTTPAVEVATMPERVTQPAMLEIPVQPESDAIAIIGMSVRFPGANSADEFWQTLNQGHDPITSQPAMRRGTRCYMHTENNTTVQPPAAGFLAANITEFDADFFNISAEEATVMDPQQRILLELTWEALEEAGIAPSSLKNSNTSVAIGIAANEFGDLILHHSDDAELSGFHASGNNPSAISGRISYQLGLKGQNIAVNTACSSSLVSLDAGCHTLKQGNADLAIVGSSNIILSPKQMKLYQANGMLAKSNHCNTFSDQADGMVRAEGAAIYVLKRLKQATLDGDNILAVIESTAINQNGASVRFMAPDLQSQRALLQQSLRLANAKPSDIDWIETHGTGTKLGDPVEMEAIVAELGSPQRKIAIGAVKSNIGHAEAAAGAAGLTKLILALQHGLIPANRFNGAMNPLLKPFQNSFELINQAKPWTMNTEKRRLAVLSSFGFSGTNAQAIISEAPTRISKPRSMNAQLIVLSAKSAAALRAKISQLLVWLESQTDIDLASVAYTLVKGRDHFALRVALSATSLDDLKVQLEALLVRETFTQANPKRRAFLFTGQGSQYKNMSQELYQQHPTYRAALDECAKLLKAHLEIPLTEILFGERSDNYLKNTTYAQPAIFAIEYALAMMWQHIGIKPEIVVGHSVGEYVAATLAGCMSLPDAIKLIAARGRIMDKTPAGKMLAVATDTKRAIDIIKKHQLLLDIAGMNHPAQTVLSGSNEEVTRAIPLFKAESIQASQLAVDKAFHSRLMDSVLSEFSEIAKTITFAAPNELSYISALTGDILTAAPDAAYWVKHLREGVNFAAAMTTLNRQGVTQCCEIGPKTILTNMAKRCLVDVAAKINWVEGLSDKVADTTQLLKSLCAHYEAGATLNWRVIWHTQPTIIRMPTYPFARKSYWPAVLGGVQAKPEAQIIESPVANDVVLTPQEQALIKCLSACLQKPVTDVDRSFTEWGGSSLELPEFQILLYTQLGLHVSLVDLNQLLLRDIAARIPENVSPQAVESAKADVGNWHQPFPLNPIQYAYWIGRQGILPLGHVSAHGYLEVKVENLDVQKLERALNRLIERHHMLRMTVNGDGLQCVLEKVPTYHIPYLDLSQRSVQEEQAVLMQIRDELSHQIKKADEWPLFDVRVTKAKQLTRLHLSFDSLIIDMYSMRLLFDEWYKLYLNETHELKPLAFTFRDYYFANETLKKQERYLKAETYWLARVKTMPLGPELPLRCDPAQVKVQTFARCNRVIPREEWTLVKDKAKQLGATPTIVLLTLFGIVLGRYSLNKEFLINLTLFRRQPIHPDVLSMSGDFTNVEVFECKTKDVHQKAFVELIKENQQRLLMDLEHADYDGVEVQRELSKHHQLDRKSVAPIVFTSLLNLTLDRQKTDGNYHSNNVWQQFGEVEFSITQTPQIWLDHKTFESDEGLVVEWDYVEALFDTELMSRIHGDYVDFIQHITKASWHEPLNDLISEKVLATMRQVNQTRKSAYLQPATLMALIEPQIAASLNQIAIRDQQRALTYAEFDLETTKMAAHLQARGVKQGDYVAVSIERSCYLLIAIIGVLKAGAVYAPIDPALTWERRDLVIKDSNAKVIITNSARATDWHGHEARLVHIEDSKYWIDTYHTISYAADDIAYLLYTSGSTGNPKGAMIDHRAIVNRLLWMRDQYQINKNDVFLQKTPISFDVSIWELFLPFLAGASLFIPKPDGHKDVDYLYSVFKDMGVTRAHFVPSMLEVFLTNPDKIDLPQLKTIFCSGEALLPNQVNAFNQQFPVVQLENLYGPTEAAVDVTYWSAPKNSVTSVPIGKPLANVEVMILDKHYLPCPIGVPGELILAGVQVGRGYLNLRDRTEQAFIVNPFAYSEEGKRGYRTGDLAYIQADHQIMYLGRFDDQLKINGQRIELGEIQTVIENQAIVQQAAVIPVFDDHKKATLVAFVQPDRVPSSLDVKARMQSALADKQQRDGFLNRIEQTLSATRSTNHKLLFDAHYRDEALFKRKSYRSFQGANLTTVEFIPFLKQQVENRRHQIPSLVFLLQAIAAYQDQSLVIPKYPYPSAGSLYPVKCYLAVGENDQGITPGYYYYDQVKHCLESCSRGAAPLTSGISLSLVIHKRLIQPMYGDFWRHFAMIEAGQVLSLLRSSCAQMGMALNADSGSSWQSNIPFLEQDDIVAGAWEWQPATLTATHVLPPAFKTWIAITSHLDNLSAGLYEWSNNTLTKRIDQPFPLALISDGDNAKIVDAASAILFFSCDEAVLDQAAIEMGQQIMTYLQNGVTANIGLCPLGTCPIPHQYAELMKSPVQLSVALGPVSQAQLQAVETSTATGQAPRLAQYIQNKLKQSSLTEVMQPQHVITVTNFPTTNNGKLNRRELISQYQQVVGQLQATITQPCTDLEQTVHQIWCQILEGKAYDRQTPFLSAGGNSILMNQLSQRIRDVFGLSIPIAEIFLNSTIENLANLIDLKQDQKFDGQGSFALINLVTKNNEKLMRTLLLSKKADINQQDNDGRTALYVAVMLNKESIVKLLLEFKPNHLLAKKSGTEPLQCAERLGHESIAALLKQHAKGQQASQSNQSLFNTAQLVQQKASEPIHQQVVYK